MKENFQDEIKAAHSIKFLFKLRQFVSEAENLYQDEKQTPLSSLLSELFG